MRAKHIIFTITLIAVLGNIQGQDFRKASWGDSPETVKKAESLPLVNQEVHNKTLHLSFVEFTKDEVYYTYTYMFFNNQLIGVKTKTAYLTKDNTRYNVGLLYNQVYQLYQEKYKNIKEEKENDLAKFNVVLKNSKIYVELRHVENEYYIIESIMKTKKG